MIASSNTLFHKPDGTPPGADVFPDEAGAAVATEVLWWPAIATQPGRR
jgi:hypothetical protein